MYIYVCKYLYTKQVYANVSHRIIPVRVLIEGQEVPEIVHISIHILLKVQYLKSECMISHRGINLDNGINVDHGVNVDQHSKP
jgi:hypothetical protein